MKAKYDVFICYRRIGFESANLIATRLKAEGYRVFIDVESLRSGKFKDEWIPYMKYKDSSLRMLKRSEVRPGRPDFDINCITISSRTRKKTGINNRFD